MHKATIEAYVPATTYEDYDDDDALDAARRDYAQEHDFELRQVEARYADDRRVIVITAPEHHCQCGRATGERCLWSGPRSETVVLEYVPPYLRGTARAAGSVDGLTERLRVHQECAELLCASEPDWAWRSDT